MSIYKAQWVCAEESVSAPLFKKTVCVTSAEGAKIDICGLGFFELYVNGEKVGDELFVPSQSDYTERDLTRAYYPIYDTLDHIVYYKTYELSEYLHEGENQIEVLLGNGWFRQTERIGEGNFSCGAPCLIFSLSVDGKEYLSDETLLWRASHITFNNIYSGEKQDFTLPEGEWYPALSAKAPSGALTPDTAPADKIMRRIVPRTLKSENGKTLYDAGENISGFVTFRGGAKGEKISVVYGEFLQDDMSLNTKSGGNLHVEEYICDGTDRICHPHFTYHGFRYFVIDDIAKDVTVCVVHSDIAVTSAFTSDNAVLNFLYTATIRSLLANMHGGVISDCPHRERLGYTGDGQLTVDVGLLTLDSLSFYEKWMLDIALCQDKKTGHVQHTAPFMGGGGGPGGWGGAIVIVPYMLYLHSGKREILEDYFANMLLWVSYMESRSENGLVVREENKGWCLGDWCTPEKVAIPEPFVNTYFLIKNLERMAEIAEILEKPSAVYREKAETLKSALISHYYDEKANSFCGGIQGADAFAIDIGLGNEGMLTALAKKYDALKEFDTGIFGTEILIRVLFENGYADTALSLLSSEKGASFGSLMLSGETTLCEYWNFPEKSHNHHMFGQVTAYLFRYLLGIHSFSEKLEIKPVSHKMALSAEGKVTTRFGSVFVKRETLATEDKITILADAETTLIYGEKTYTIPSGETMTFVFENL